MSNPVNCYLSSTADHPANLTLAAELAVGGLAQAPTRTGTVIPPSFVARSRHLDRASPLQRDKSNVAIEKGRTSKYGPGYLASFSGRIG